MWDFFLFILNSLISWRKPTHWNLLVVYLCLTSEFPGNTLCYSWSFQVSMDFFCISNPNDVYKSLVIQNSILQLQMLMTDQFRLLFSALTPTVMARHALDLWLSKSHGRQQPTPPAHLVLPHHQSGISKNRSSVPPRGQLYFMSRIANDLCMVKSLVCTFLF